MSPNDQEGQVHASAPIQDFVNAVDALMRAADETADHNLIDTINERRRSAVVAAAVVGHNCAGANCDRIFCQIKAVWILTL